LAPTPQSGLLPLQIGRYAAGRVGPIFQEREQRLHVLQGVKHVATASCLGHDQRLPRAQPFARIRDGRFGREALVLQFQQPDTPSLGVTMVLDAQQLTERGSNVHANPHWPAALEDFVVSANPNTREVLLPVVDAGLLHGLLKNVVDRGHRDLVPDNHGPRQREDNNALVAHFPAQQPAEWPSIQRNLPNPPSPQCVSLQQVTTQFRTT